MVYVSISRLGQGLRMSTQFVLDDGFGGPEGTVAIAFDGAQVILPLADAHRLHQVLGSLLAHPDASLPVNETAER